MPRTDPGSHHPGTPFVDGTDVPQAVRIVERVLGRDVRVLVVCSEDAVECDLPDIPVVGDEVGDPFIEGMLRARTFTPESDVAWIAVFVVGNCPGFLSDLRYRIARESRIVGITLNPTRPLHPEALEHRLTMLPPFGMGVVLESDSHPLDAEWMGDGIDESLLDCLESDAGLHVVVEMAATRIPKSVAAHPGRCRELSRLGQRDILAAAGIAAGGGRSIFVLSRSSLGSLRSNLSSRTLGAIPLDIVVRIDGSDTGGPSYGLPAEAVPHIVPAHQLGNVLTDLRARATRYVLAKVDGRPDAEGDRERDSHPAAGLARSFGFEPSDLRREHEAVLARELGPDVERWFERYEPVGDRARYMWQWCVHGAELTSLPCVDRDLADHVRDTKVLAIFLAVLLDDAVDVRRDTRLLGEVLEVVRTGRLPTTANRTPNVRKYLETTLVFVREFEDRTRTYPRYEEFASLLRFDCEQFENAVRYGDLVGEDLELLSEVEHDLYLPHGMHMLAFATLDLMCSPAFARRDLGRLREAIWHAACMGRAGNVLGTWHREILQRDFTSGVFARALLRGDLSIDRLSSEPPESIAAIVESCGHESAYRSRWLQHRDEFVRAIRAIDSVDLLPLVEGQDRFCRMHLAGRGRI